MSFIADAYSCSYLRYLSYLISIPKIVNPLSYKWADHIFYFLLGNFATVSVKIVVRDLKISLILSHNIIFNYFHVSLAQTWI